MKKLHQDVYVGIVVILVSLAGFLYGVLTVSGEAGVVPKVLALIMLAFGIYITGDGIFKTSKQADCNYTMAWSKIKPCFITFGAVVAYVAAFFFIGYYVATFFFLTGLMYVLKAGSLKKIVLIAFCADVFLYVVFVMIFAVNMSRVGILF